MAYISSLPPGTTPVAPELRAADATIIGNRYRVIELLGRGGMAVVYRVYDVSLGRELALKQLRHNELDKRSEATRSLFEREFFVLAQLAHPRIIAVYDYGVDVAGPYYTMELLEGGDLTAAPLPVDRACALAIEICSSLAILHARRLVHRDVSPRNIRCTRDGHAKLIDFGAMVPMGPCAHIVGTPAFVAPEVVTHSGLDGRADLFSLGATLYYALTGQAPFPARSFSELRALWSEEPLAPSALAPGIPAALDALCGSLLRIDPSERPRSVFDVMQRLCAIANVSADEPTDVREAYLVAPALLGRHSALRRFNHGMRRALQGAGSTLAFEGAAGLGRSRALDACALEAKTLRANVLRGTVTTAEVQFGLVQRLLEQLLQVFGDTALAAAKTAGIWEVLFEPDSSAAAPSAHLRDLSDPTLERASLQAAIAAWIVRVCESQVLLIAVDDIHRADEPSLAMLASLALEASGLRLLLLITLDAEERAQAPSALKVLLEHAVVERLQRLTRADTEALLKYVFGPVPHLAMLAERLYDIALGNPGHTMELARHLVHTSVIRYEHGQWTLPGELERGDLPAKATDIWVARVAELPPLARQLIEAQALLDNALRRQDYALLAPHATMAEVDAAITNLLDRAVVSSDGELYGLSHRALIEALNASLDPVQKRKYHLALYDLLRRAPDSHPYLLVHHLLEAEQIDAALDLLATLHRGSLDLRDPVLSIEPHRLANTLERALELAIARNRPARELSGLRGRIVGMSHLVEGAGLYAKYAPVWCAQIARDSGLEDYRKLDPSLPASTRLQQALTTASARFASAPAHDRVYSVEDAVRLLVVYVALSVIPAARTLDLELMAALPGVLEPFVGLSPLLAAVWHNVTAMRDYFGGRPVRARARWGEVYETLGQSISDNAGFVRAMRDGVAQVIAKFEACLGNMAATSEWAAKLESRALNRVGAMYELRVACLMQGDLVGAEYYARQGEVLALRNSSRQMFYPSWSHELTAHWALRDLSALGRIVDALRALAQRHRGWKAPCLAAEGVFHLLRGDRDAAHTAFEQTIAEACPNGPDCPISVFAWTDAIVGSMALELERDAPRRVQAIGENALSVCSTHAFDLAFIPISQQLALAETQLGRFGAAASRIDALIASQIALGMQGLQLARSYVIRSRIALDAGDNPSAVRFAALAAAQPGGDRLLLTAVREDPVVAAAQRAGIDLALGDSKLQVALFGALNEPAESPRAIRYREALLLCADRGSRIERALGLLCDLVDSDSAQLYLTDGHGVLQWVAVAAGDAPNDSAVEFAQSCFTEHVLGAEATIGITRAAAMFSMPGVTAYTDEHGSPARLFVLSCFDRGKHVYVGAVAMRVKASWVPHAELTTLISTIAACLLQAGDSTGVTAA